MVQRRLTRQCVATVILILASTLRTEAQGVSLVLAEYNCENLFDCRHDTLKDDQEYLPDSERHWTIGRYWKKVNDIARAIAQCGEADGSSAEYHLPDLVALSEVENDSTLLMLTRGSALRGVGYRHVMTSSPDKRGVDVALLYNPLTFWLIDYRSLRIKPIRKMRPTRDILYVKGWFRSKDTLHIFVLHAPSRSGGEKHSEPFRLHAMKVLTAAIDSVRNATHDANIIVCGDFNDYSENKSLLMLTNKKLAEVSQQAIGLHHKETGCTGTYKYQGFWDSLDHIFLSSALAQCVQRCYILDAPWLLEDDKTWGGKKPFRTYLGPVYHKGISDHLPLVLWLSLDSHI